MIGGPASTEVINVLHLSGPSRWSLLVNNRLQAGGFKEVAHSLLSSNDCYATEVIVEENSGYMCKGVGGEKVGATLGSSIRNLRVSLIMKSKSHLGEKDTVICKLFLIWRSYPKEEERNFGVHLNHLKHVQ